MDMDNVPLSPEIEYMSSLSETLDHLKTNEIESLLNEIDDKYADVNLEDIADFGVNDEAIEKQGSFIEDVLDEIEMKEPENDNNWQLYPILNPLSANAIKLRAHKQRTFENLLSFENVIASHLVKIKKENENNEKQPLFIENANRFYVPVKCDYLLHGFVRNIVRFNAMRRIVPSVVLRLVHSYYSSPNNAYCEEWSAYGINWTEHNVIFQLESCNLWRFDKNDNEWKVCNDLVEGGQLTILYDLTKGFSRFIHFDHKTKSIKSLQIIEANEQIKHVNVKQNKSFLDFDGFDFSHLYNNNNINNENLQNTKTENLQYRIEIYCANHAFFAKQLHKCYDNLIDSEMKNEIKMLKKPKLLSTNDEFKDENPSIDNLSEYVLGLQSRDDETKHIKNSHLIRRLLSNETKPPIQQIIDCGIIQRLLYLMEYSPSQTVQFECAWSITNIASSNEEHTATLLKFNAIPSLIKVFRSKSSIVELKEQCLWALGNISGDSVHCRDSVLKADILHFVLPLIRPYRMLMFKENEKSKCQRQMSMMKNIVWTVSNLNRNKPLPSTEYIVLSLHALNILLKDTECITSVELMTDCCWTLSYLTDYDPSDLSLDVHSLLLDTQIIDILIHFIVSSHQDTNVSVKHPALRTIGNIATGSDALTTKLLTKKGILNAIGLLLKSSSKGIKRETLWLISNITAGRQEQIELILKNNDLMGGMVQILTHRHEENSVKREAVWALANAVSGGSHEQIRYIAARALPAMCDYLNQCVNANVDEHEFKKQYGKVLIVCLEGFDRMLDVGLHDGLLLNEGLHNLQTQNVMAECMIQCGVINSLDQLLNDKNSSEDLKDRIQTMFDSYFPFRHIL